MPVLPLLVVALSLGAVPDSVFDNADAWESAKLLKDGGDERVVYTQIEQPMISNRDHAMTVKKLWRSPMAEFEWRTCGAVGCSSLGWVAKPR